MVEYLRRRRQCNNRDTCLAVCGTEERLAQLADIAPALPDIVAFLRAEKIFNGDIEEVNLNDFVSFALYCKEELDREEKNLQIE